MTMEGDGDGQALSPLLERDMSFHLSLSYHRLQDIVNARSANNPDFILNRLEDVLDSLRRSHTDMRKLNERVVRVGIDMEQALKPIEHGMRLEKEQKDNQKAAVQNHGTAANSTLRTEEGRAEEDPIAGV
jgi:hypothetical protein